MVKTARKIILFFAFQFIFSLIAWSALADDLTLFGPQDFEIRKKHLHFSHYKFKVKDPVQALIIITKNTPKKELSKGFVHINKHKIRLHGFFDSDETELVREIRLQKKNSLSVDLKGTPGASIRVEIRKKGEAPVNHKPVVADHPVNTDEDTAVAFILSGSDPDGDPLAYSVLSWPTHGALGGAAPALTYTPHPDFSGTDSFTFKVNDGTVDSDPAVVDITVNPVNDDPTADDATFSLAEDATAGTQVGIVSAADPDAGDSLTFAIIDGCPNGLFAIAATGLITVADSNALDYETTSTYALIVRVQDSVGLTDTAAITVNITDVNEPPTASTVNITTNEDTASAPMTPAVADPDQGDSHAFSIVTQPTNGIANVENNALIYTPSQNFYGSNSFTFSATDSGGLSVVGTADVTVNPVNDPPVAYAGPDKKIFLGNAVILDGKGSFDVDKDPLSYHWSFSSVPAGSAAALFGPSSPSTTFIPDLPGNYEIQLIVSDGDSSSDPDLVLVTADPLPSSVTETKLAASDGKPEDFFGQAVSVSGNYAIVGAPGDGHNGESSGAAYVFERHSPWTQKAKLTASYGKPGDRFGSSVSISGDYAVVGAPGADGGISSGASAYIFARNGSVWEEQAALTVNDGSPGNYFGCSVAIDAPYAIVGAYGADDFAGAVYVFFHNGEEWIQQAKLTVGGMSSFAGFGYSVAMEGDLVIVGAPDYAEEEKTSGAAFIFRREGSTWTEEKRLTASDGEDGDAFGGSVSISTDFAVVGAFGDDAWSGSAYIFNRLDSTWIEHTKLRASDAEQYDEFGYSVSISGDFAIVGADADDEYKGSAYVFRRQDSAWIEYTKLVASDGEMYEGFGFSVAIDGMYAIAGALADNDLTGSAYIYTFEPDPVTPIIRLLEPDGVEDKVDARFTIRWTDSDFDDNATISLYYARDKNGTGATLIESGIMEDPDGPGNDEYLWVTSPVPEGSYYIYAVIEDGKNEPVVHYSEGTLTINHSKIELSPADPGMGDNFGCSAAIDGDYAIIGACGNDDNGMDAGSAYIFKRDPEWSQRFKLRASDGDEYDGFGGAVAINGEYAVVGAPYDDNDAGSAYVFKRDGSNWIEQVKLMAADRAPHDYFGGSVAVNGDYAIIGTDGDDNNSGSAYVFKRDGSTWTQVTKLTAADRRTSDYFGCSVSIDGDYVVVGAWGKPVRVREFGMVSYSGAAYVFKREGSDWLQTAKLTMAYGVWKYATCFEGYRFGYSVSIDDPYLIVGAPGQIESMSPGAAYVFKREGETWTYRAALTATDPVDWDLFGDSVAIHDDYALVAAPGLGTNALPTLSAAYVFERDREAWNLKSKLTHGEAAEDVLFGASIALGGSYGLVGAISLPGTEWNSTYPGEAYAYLIYRVNISTDYAKIVVGDSTTLSWSVLDVKTVDIDNGIGPKPPKGSMQVSPTETTTYTILATGPWGTFTDQVTVTVAPFGISIDSPANNDLISRSDVMVEGTIRNPLGRELGVTVNGVVAIVNGDRFVANHVPLEEGENTITAIAVDLQGNAETASITLWAEAAEDYIRITADPESGVAPLETTLRVEGSFTFPSLTDIPYTGPGNVELLDRPTENEYNVRITVPGIYYFTIEVTDELYSTYTDTVAIEVLDLAALDALLQAKWNGMRDGLSAGDIPKALGHIAQGAKARYEYNFNLLSAHLGEISAGLQDIGMVQALGRMAEYEMWAMQGGQMYSFYILFVKDPDGIWRIQFF